MAQDGPRYKLQLMTVDPEGAKSRQQILADKAKAAFRRARPSADSRRVQDMFRQSDEMLDYDLTGAAETARKAELLSRELPVNSTKRLK